MYLHTRSDGNFFNLARLQVKTKFRKVLISEMLFANDVVLAGHTEGAEKRFIISFAHACCEFGLTTVPRRPASLAETSAARGGRGLHLPRLHHLQQPVPTQRTEQTDWQISSSPLSGTSRKEGLGQHDVHHQHQDTDVPGLRT